MSSKPKSFSAGHWLQGLRTVKQVLPHLSILSAKEVAWIIIYLMVFGDVISENGNLLIKFSI